MKISSILVSQPTPQSEKSPYFELAQKYNLKIDFRPFIRVEGIPVAEFRRQRISLQNFTGIIITSKSAIDNYFRLAKETRFNVPTSMKFFCITEVIAYYLQKYITYRKRKIFYGERTLDDLLPQLKKQKKEKFLLPVADVHKPTVPNKLKRNRVSFTKSVMYRTVSSDLSDLKDIKYDLLVFFSPSGIISLRENFPDFEQNNVRIAGFGTATAKAVRTSGLRLDIRAPSKDAPSMVMALNNYIRKQR